MGGGVRDNSKNRAHLIDITLISGSTLILENYLSNVNPNIDTILQKGGQNIDDLRQGKASRR